MTTSNPLAVCFEHGQPLGVDEGVFDPFTMNHPDPWPSNTSPEAPTPQDLRLSEPNYHTLFESMDQGFCLVELIYAPSGQATDYRFVEVNVVFEQQTGYHHACGKRATELAPNLNQAWIDTVDGVARTGEPLRTEAFFEDPARWYTISLSRMGAASSRLVAAIFDDITGRKQAEVALRESESQKAFLLALSDLLRPEADPVAIQAIVTRAAMNYFGVDRAYYCEIDGDLVTIRRDAHQADLPSVANIYSLSQMPLFKNVSQVGSPIVVTDVSTTDIIDEGLKQLCLQMQILAYINVPVMKAGQLVGNFCITQRSQRIWTTLEIALAREIAERTWATVERARAEAALLASELEFRTITQAAPALVWVCSATGENIYFNARWYEYTGQTTDQASGHGWTTAMHPDDVAYILPYRQHSQQTGEPYQGQVRYQRHDGLYRWHVFQALPRRDETDQIQAWYGVSVDIDDAKQAQEALQVANRRKDEFLAMLAHELRNPMATLRSGLQILTLTQANDETSTTVTASTLAMMNRQTDHLVRMVDDLLDVSRISQDKIQLHTSRLNLVEVVSQTIDSMRALFKEQGRSLRIDLSTTPVYVNGDATRLSQVVSNLLTNGVRYTGEAGQVWLSVEHYQQEVIIRVRDNGIGLAADQLVAIFELFVQVDNSTARSRGGLGLGLTLVKRLVELHDGRVEAQSAGVGKGSTFTVHLPTLEMAKEVAPQPIPPSVQSSSKRLLIIDDNADAAFTLAMFLKLKGYEPHTRHSGRAGIDAAETLKPAAILLDLGMPDLDGYATCQVLREQPWGKQVPVIAISGYGQEEDRQRTKEAGFTRHLVKPVDLEALLSLLTESLSNPKMD